MKLSNKNRGLIEKICRGLGYVNPLIPKKKKKIFIYNSTPSYQNNYAMYNYLINNEYQNTYQIYYYMPESDKYISQAKNVTLGNSLKGALYHYLTSKYVFFDTGNMRIKPSKTQCVMNLWHGVPFKRIGFLSKTAEKNMPTDLMNTFSKIILPNHHMKKTYADSFLLNDEQFFCGGQPRNDLLISDSNPLEKLNIDSKKYDKVIMWMTTYRISKDERLRHTSDSDWSKTGLPLLLNQEIVNSVSQELAEQNILLLVKQHTTGKTAKEPISETNNIKLLEESDFLEKGLQLYEVLGQCDALITDYSSVFIDYLLVNRPIGFVVNDIEDYEKNNGFNFEKPLEYMPGQKLLSLDDLSQFILAIANEKDNYNSQRKELSAYFNEYHKANNCQYILENMSIRQ